MSIIIPFESIACPKFVKIILNIIINNESITIFLKQKPKNHLDCKVHPSLNINVFHVIISKLEEDINEFHLFESILLKFSICIWVLYDSMCSTQKKLHL
jgi:hypothetical protein